MRKRIFPILLMTGFGLSICSSAGAAPLKLLSANIGNSDLICVGYNWKLCLNFVEKRVTEAIRALDADIVFLQEVVPAEHCQKKPESKPGFVCYDFANRPEDQKEQARRILGPDYTIAVTKGAYEAIGVKKGVGHIIGCSDGDLCLVERLPIPEACDPGFSVTAIDAEILGARVRLINAHPDSLSKVCRAQEVKSAFQAVLAGKTIMAGDWNLDPYRDTDESAKIFRAEFSRQGFHYLSGIPERDPPYPTIFIPLMDIPLKTIDHIISDFAKGSCMVLGVSPDTERLDRGFDLDHRALLCQLQF